MINKMLLLLTLLLCTTAQAGEDPVETIKKKITKAENTYTTELAKAQADVIKWLDGRDAAARKKGDKNTVNTVKQQREKLDTEGTIPKPIPINISRKIDTARDMLDASYSSLMKEALMANLDDLADELEDKRVQLAEEKPNQNVFKLVSRYAQNMVENGSFEWPEVPSGTDHVQNKNVGWSEVGEIARFQGVAATHGIQVLQFGGKVSQQVKGFVPGERYIVIAYVATYATPNKPETSCTVSVKIAGEKETKVVTATNKGSKSGYAMPGVRSKWEQITLVFKALGEEHELEFVTEDPSNNVVHLDNVSILPYIAE